jgi:hypothetical protein
MPDAVSPDTKRSIKENSSDSDSFVDALVWRLSIRRLRGPDVLVDLDVLQRLADHLRSILPQYSVCRLDRLNNSRRH